jgi:hypothetical protein
MVQANQATMWNTIPKSTKAKRAGGMAQVVKCLPSKHGALSSTPITNKKNKSKKKWSEKHN